MKAHYRAFNGRLLIEVEGATIKDLFEQIGPVAEVLDGDDACGKCASPHIYPRARVADGFTFYELVCSDCGAKLSFGQHKEGGTLWAKRTDEHGNKMDYRGWQIYLGIAAPPVPPAAPPAKPAPKAPVPAQTEPDPKLEAYLKRCTDRASTGEVYGEICDKIREASSEGRADRAWRDAIKAHGDPATKTAALRPVLAYLLNVAEVEMLGTPK